MTSNIESSELIYRYLRRKFNKFNSAINNQSKKLRLNQYINGKYLRVIINEKIKQFNLSITETKKNLLSLKTQLVEDKNSEDLETADLGLLPPPPIWSRLLIWTLGSGTFILLIWGSITSVEETIVITGEITTLSPEVKVAAIDPGRITKILVKPYQFVENGGDLMEYSDDETEMRLISLINRRKILSSNIVQAESLHGLNIKQLTTKINYDNNILSKYKNLYDEGAMSEVDYLQKEFESKNNELKLLAQKEQYIQTLNQLNETKEQLDTSIKELEAKLDRFKIKSPVNGFIQTLNYQSTGQLIQAGEVVITIIPDMDLVAKVSIPSKLSAPVDLDSPATLDIDAFPSSDFGAIEATVVSISPMSSAGSNQSQQKNYQAILSLDQPEAPEKLTLTDLRPGMGLSAKLKLREKPIISTIFDFMSDLFDPLTENR